MVTNNEHILSDVQITNPLCPTNERGAARQPLYAAEQGEKRKANKYTERAQQHHATFIPFVMEATGGMSQSAEPLYEKIIRASRDSGSLWPHEIIARELQRCHSRISAEEKCNDYDCWTVSGNRSSCNLCSCINNLSVC